MTTEFFVGIFFCLLLVLPAAEDFRTGLISDGKTMLLAAGGILHWLFWGSVGDLAAAGIVFLFFGLLYFGVRGAMGSADVLLAGAISLWLSAPSSVVFVWLSFFLGGIFGGLLILFHVKHIRDGVPFAPFLCAAGAVSYFFGDLLWQGWLLFF